MAKNSTESYGTANQSIDNKLMVFSVVGVLIALFVGFVVGMQFQKSKTTTAAVTDTTTQMPTGQGGQNQMRIRGGFVEVSAVTSTSITVTGTMDGTSNSYTINDQTTVNDNGTEATISDIKVGDIVMVRTSSSDAKLATQISLNIQMPSGPMGGAGPEGDTQTQTN